MAIYIFPIFLFGCAITGIVLMAVQQASDWAKDEVARKISAQSSYPINDRVSAELNARQSESKN